jgi:hypothetical protein
MEKMAIVKAKEKEKEAEAEAEAEAEVDAEEAVPPSTLLASIRRVRSTADDLLSGRPGFRGIFDETLDALTIEIFAEIFFKKDPDQKILQEFNEWVQTQSVFVQDQVAWFREIELFRRTPTTMEEMVATVNAMFEDFHLRHYISSLSTPTPAVVTAPDPTPDPTPIVAVVAEGACTHVPTPDPTLVVTIAVTNKNCYLLARRRADERELYITPPRLLHGCKQLFEKLRGKKVWDGCNGLGSISNFLRGEGFDVVVSDKYVYDGVVQQKIDFLDRTITPPAGVEAIIMNPPFRQAKKFLERALEFGKNL